MYEVGHLSPNMKRVFVVILLAVVSAQFLPIHQGDYETTIDGFRFQFHDEFHVLLVLHDLDCFISDIPRGSPIEKKLLDGSSRNETYAKIIPLIEAGKASSRTELNQVHSKYDDMLLRALCFRSEIFNLDISSIL